MITFPKKRNWPHAPDWFLLWATAPHHPAELSNKEVSLIRHLMPRMPPMHLSSRGASLLRITCKMLQAQSQVLAAFGLGLGAWISAKFQGLGDWSQLSLMSRCANLIFEQFEDFSGMFKFETSRQQGSWVLYSKLSGFR